MKLRKSRKTKRKTNVQARASQAKQDQHQERHLLHRVSPHLRVDPLPLQHFLHAENIQETLPLFHLDIHTPPLLLSNTLQRITSQQTSRSCNEAFGKKCYTRKLCEPHNIFTIWQMNDLDSIILWQYLISQILDFELIGSASRSTRLEYIV